MKAKQAIDLLENGIMPCILTSSTAPINSGTIMKSRPSDNVSLPNRYIIDYIYRYSRLNSYYTFYSLFNNVPLFANNLNDEISTNNNSGGGQYS